MKKWGVRLSALLLTFVLTACGAGGTGGSSDQGAGT